MFVKALHTYIIDNLKKVNLELGHTNATSFLILVYPLQQYALFVYYKTIVCFSWYRAIYNSIHNGGFFGSCYEKLKGKSKRIFTSTKKIKSFKIKIIQHFFIGLKKGMSLILIIKK